MTKLIKSSSWVDALIDLNDFNDWYGQWLDLSEAWVKAMMTWHTLYETKPEIATQARAKAEKLLKMINEQPDWEERYEWVPPDE